VEETPAVEGPQKVDYSELNEGIVVADYDINSYKLSADQKELLNKIGELLKEDESLELIVYGNTCSLGSETINYEIGMKRANEAKNYLAEMGIDADRIEVESNGYSNPVADNSTESGRKSNRRITFKLK
ncbi:MAG: OmpA family protein, partial [Paramuribaculum sp.]|nr:OmpA family protein [Paramuribaculum sp.]